MKKLLLILLALFCLTGTSWAATYANSATTNNEGNLVAFIVSVSGSPTNGITAATATNIVTQNAILKLNGIGTNAYLQTPRLNNPSVSRLVLSNSLDAANTHFRMSAGSPALLQFGTEDDTGLYGATVWTYDFATGNLINHFGTFLGSGLGLTNISGTNLIAGTISSNKLDFAVATSQQLQDATNATGGIKAGAFSLGANSINSWDDVTNYFTQGLVGYNFNGAEVVSTNGVVVRSNSWPAAYTLLNGDVRLVSSNGSPYLLTKDANSTTFTYYLGQLANLWWTNPVSAASISNLYNLSIGGSAASLTFGSTSVITNNGNSGLRQYVGTAPTGKFTEWGPSGIFLSDATNNTTFNLSGGSATNSHVFLVRTGRKIAGTADASSLSGQLDTISFLPTGGILMATNVFVEGNLSATNGFSSGGTTFTRMPTNTPGDTQVITAVGTAGYTKWASGGTGIGGPQTNTYWDVAGTLPAVEADASGPVLYFKAHDGAKRWRIDDGNSQLNGSNSISLGVTGVNVNSDIKAFYANRIGATTVGVPNGVVTIQGTVNFNSAPAFTVTDNGVSTTIMSNMVQALVGSFTTTTNAGDAINTKNGVQSLISSNRVYTGTLTADTNNITYAYWTNLYSSSYSNALAWFQSDGSLVGTLNGSTLTNLTAANIVYTPGTLASATNTLTLNNDYTTYVATTDVSITNLGKATSGRWTTLQVTNSAAAAITVRLAGTSSTVAVRAQGTGTTNALIIPAAKIGMLSFLMLGSTNYVTTVEP